MQAFLRVPWVADPTVFFRDVEAPSPTVVFISGRLFLKNASIFKSSLGRRPLLLFLFRDAFFLKMKAFLRVLLVAVPYVFFSGRRGAVPYDYFVFRDAFFLKMQAFVRVLLGRRPLWIFLFRDVEAPSPTAIYVSGLQIGQSPDGSLYRI